MQWGTLLAFFTYCMMMRIRIDVVVKAWYFCRGDIRRWVDVELWLADEKVVAAGLGGVRDGDRSDSVEVKVT